jgi:hypothetical protein
MSSQLGNWLDLSGTSNLYIQTYVKGFVDMSGGNLVLRNNSIYVNAGDVSMGGRLFVQGNATFQTAPVMSGANITTGTIPASAISGGVQTNGMDLSTNQTAFGIKTFGNIITASAGIISYSDVSFGGNLVTKNIVGTSFNGGGLNQFNGITVTGTTLSIGSSGGTGVAGVDLTSNQTINGIKTFGNEIDISGVIKFPDNSTMISNTDSLDWNKFLTLDINTNIAQNLPYSGPYQFMAISANGQYITGVTNGGQIYVSSNYGVTQTAYDSARSWNSVSMSANGQYQTAVVNTGYIYVSINYGLNWTPYMTDTNRAWASVSVSATGQYQTAVVSTGYIYVSSNYGVTWTPYMTDANRAWTSISISSSGQYQTAVINGGYIYVSSNYGLNWTPYITDANRAWNCVSISSTGQYQIATQTTDNNAWVSKNYGNTWSALATTSTTYSCLISGNGQYMFISQYRIEGGYYHYNIVSISTNFGSTINNTTTINSSMFYGSPTYLTLSSNSKYFLIWGGTITPKVYQTPYSKLITGNLVVSKTMTINYEYTNNNALTVGGDCAFTGGNVQLAINGGYVGIGTANMKNYLQITCNATSLAFNAPDAGSNHGIAIWNPAKSGSTIYTMAMGVDYTTGAGYINAAGNTSTQPVCLNTRGGKVGIGTTTPNGTLNIYETTGTGDSGAASGSLVIEHGNNGGVSSIVFPSRTNYNSDYGYIRYRDDVNNSTTTEQGRLEIGTENDNGRADGNINDAVILQKSGGYVGIGTTNPGFPLHVATASVSLSSASGYYFATTGGIYSLGGSASSVVAYFVGNVGCSNAMFAISSYTVSDQRAKTNIETFDPSLALAELRTLKPRTFTYIDTVTHGPDINYGFISQEVENQIPYSVKNIKKELPSVYEIATITNDASGETILTLNTKSTTVFNSDPDGKDASGNPIQIKLYDPSNNEIKTTIKSILDDKRFSISSALNMPSIFVYGHYINDYKYLDKDSIFTITTAALQSIDATVESQSNTIKSLQEQINTLQDQVSGLNSQNSQITDILSRLAKAGI